MNIDLMQKEFESWWNGRGLPEGLKPAFYMVWQSAVAAAIAAQTQQPTLAKHQPCGCVVCTCEHETQCQGCGAKNCGTHAVGQMPNPVYLQSQAQQSRWISVEERLPDVKKNDYKNVLIALTAHHNGKTYVYEASYLNEKLFTDYEGDVDADEEKAFSGWHQEVERDGDYYFDPITHGTVTHWMEKPLPPAPVSKSEQPMNEVNKPEGDEKP